MFMARAFKVEAGQGPVESCYAQGWTDGLLVVALDATG